jgi:redox-sensitive bicupin YhaK (pirin superfamily)
MHPGDMQRMTAGVGITHSEFNHSEVEPLHFLQIWILPERTGLTPSYEQLHFPEEERRSRLRLVASRDGRDGSLTIHQDLSVLASILAPGETIEHAIAADRHAWVQVSRGALQLNGLALVQGDGAAVSDESIVKIEATEPTELLLFDLA